MAAVLRSCGLDRRIIPIKVCWRASPHSCYVSVIVCVVNSYIDLKTIEKSPRLFASIP